MLLTNVKTPAYEYPDFISWAIKQYVINYHITSRQGGKSMAKFNKGDKVSLTGEVTYYSEAWGEDLTIKFDTDGDYELALEGSAIREANVVVTKKAPPPAPAGGSVIRIYGSLYVVDNDGRLHSVRRDGTTTKSYSTWDSIDHAAATVL